MGIMRKKLKEKNSREQNEKNRKNLNERIGKKSA